MRKQYFVRPSRNKDDTVGGFNTITTTFDDLSSRRKQVSRQNTLALHIEEAISIKEKNIEPPSSHHLIVNDTNNQKNFKVRRLSSRRREKSQDGNSIVGASVESKKQKAFLTIEDLIQMPEFYNYVDKLLGYLDEIYYIEKKRSVLEKSEKIQLKLLPSEIERINLKATECAYAYSGILFHTVWHANLKWEVLIHFLIRLVRNVYKDEPDEDIVDKLMDGKTNSN